MENYLIPNITVQESIEIIKEKIKSKTPFSFTRFGDGEIYVLNKNGYKYNGWEKKLCNNWGYSFPDELNTAYKEIGDIIKFSFLNTDMIGIMSEKHDIFTTLGMEFNPNTWSISNNKLEEIGLDTKKLLVAEHMLPRYQEFGDINEFSKIIQGNDIHIISPRVEELKSKNLDKILGVTVGYTNHGYEINLKNRDSLLKSFEEITEPIVILGTSLLKDYGPILSNKYGKIALDLGATLDAWAGIYSRPWFKEGGLQEYLTIK